MAAFLAFRKSRKLRFAAPVLLGFVLSASVEIAQLFTPTRDCSALDVTTNVIGTILGVLLGSAFEKIAQPAPFCIPDRGALALLFIWTGSVLFPLFPVLSTAMDTQKILRFTRAPLFDFAGFLSPAASWLAAGFLISGAGLRPARFWLALSILLIPAQIFVITRQPQPSEILGAIAGALLFCIPGVGPLTPWIFLGTLIFRGLAPFHFLSVPHEFLWTPFRGLLETGWQSGIEVLLEKAFNYGTAVWLLERAAKPWWLSASIVGLVLGAIEVAQRWLPGRTPEITDPLIALAVAAALWLLKPRLLQSMRNPFNVLS